MISLTVDVSEAEYIEAQRRVQSSSRSKVILQRVQLTVLCVISIAGIYTSAKGSDNTFAFLCALLTPTFLLYGVVVACFKNTSLHKAYLKAAITLNGGTVEIDSEGYRWKTPGQSHGVLYWSAFTSWSETSHTITMVRGGLLHILQKSALTGEACDELRTMCLQNIGPEHVSRSLPS